MEQKHKTDEQINPVNDLEPDQSFRPSLYGMAGK